MKQRVRSIFISDSHLGCKYARSTELLNFLRNYECNYLYLVGDFIDGWNIRRNFYWDDVATLVIRRVLGMVKEGTRVIWVLGNHDEVLRNYLDHGLARSFGNIILTNEFIHNTIDNKKMLIIHGDCFDHITSQLKWMYYFGDIGYNFLLWANHWANVIRRKLGLRYMSYSQYIKQNVKEAMNFINNFEDVVSTYTKKRGCSGVICGHIHVPADKDIKGIKYYNCGDWFESCSAILEDWNGEFKLVKINQQ